MSTPNAATLAENIRALRPAIVTSRTPGRVQKQIDRIYDAHLSNGRFDALTQGEQWLIAQACEYARGQSNV